MEITPLKRIMMERGHSNRWLAKQCEINEAGLSFIVNGKREPTLRVALKISRVLGVSVEELWGWIEKPVP